MFSDFANERAFSFNVGPSIGIFCDRLSLNQRSSAFSSSGYFVDFIRLPLDIAEFSNLLLLSYARFTLNRSTPKCLAILPFDSSGCSS